jgi:hypothetical protein
VAGAARVSLRECLRVVIKEEYMDRLFAECDLAAL